MVVNREHRWEMGNKRERHQVVLQAETRAHLPGHLGDSIKGLVEQREQPENCTYLQGVAGSLLTKSRLESLAMMIQRCGCKTVRFDDDSKW